jgi:hypothetical protein
VHAVCGPPLPPPQRRAGPARRASSGLDLKHVPYPFKTITAAVQYIRDNQPGADLPYTSSTTPPVEWSYAVIHLLPGIYGPGTSIDEGSRLPRNGETFPIVLPPRVSLQGTSALDTILDASTTHRLARPDPAVRDRGRLW